MNVKIHLYRSSMQVLPYIFIFGISATLLLTCSSEATAEQYFLKSKHSHKCLHQNGYTQGNGDPITQWECVSQPNVEVEILPNMDGTIFLQFVHSQKCVHVHGNSIQNDTPITQWDCIDQGNVKWYLEPTGESINKSP